MVKTIKEEKNKKVLKSFWSIVNILFGTFLLALGDGIFLVPFSIVSGGISGISILLSSAGFLTVDIWSYIIMWSLFFLGVIFLGLKFSLSTLISTIFFPIFLSLILRTNIATGLISLLLHDGMSIINNNGNIIVSNLELMDVGRLLVIGVIGGSLAGLGCGVTFNGGGSTGGLDILVFIINKYTNIKTSVLSFTLDGLIVFSGIVISLVEKDSTQFYSGLIGIISAFMCAVMIEVSYTVTGGGLILEITTNNYKEINSYVIHDLDRSTTIYNAIGGYSKDVKKVIRLAISTREFIKVRDKIAQIDPKAFVICYQAKAVNGEGWNPLTSSKENTISDFSKKIKKKAKKDGK